MASASGSDWVRTVRGLYLVAMAVFVVTVVIGILNGLDLVEFPRDVILTHVHAGTLGWLTLGIVATTFWLYRSSDRRLGIALAVLIPLYAAAFFSGNLPARAATGTLVLGAVVWLLVWAWRTYLAGPRSLPQLAATLGLTTFTYGAIIGVILQIQFAAGAAWLTGDAIGAHASAMVFSYVVLTAMGIIEWRLLGTTGLPRAGLLQLGALFVGGLVISLGLLTGQGQAAGGLYLLTELVAVILFAVRMLPRALRVPWAAAEPIRGVGLAAVWVLVAMLLFMYLVFQFISAGGDVTAISVGLLIASDHSVFIGVMTNLLFALVAAFVAGGVARTGTADQVIFWAFNGGLVVFLAGLISESVDLKRIGSPIMGSAILLGLALLAMRLWSHEGAEPA